MAEKIEIELSEIRSNRRPGDIIVRVWWTISNASRPQFEKVRNPQRRQFLVISSLQKGYKVTKQKSKRLTNLKSDDFGFPTLRSFRAVQWL